MGQKEIIDIRFKTRVDITPRVEKVAEAFGIGLGETEFVIFDQFEIDVEQGDRIYITGQSGSGKSLLLRELAARLGKTRKVIRIEDVELDPELPVIEQIGANYEEGSFLLSKAGVSDPYIYCRKPGELSDGQRYRVRLAKMIETDADVWVSDEFGAILDRHVAKAVAFGVAKAAMAAGKTLIVATTHTDLADELGATKVINKSFRERIEFSEGDGVPAASTELRAHIAWLNEVVA